LAACRPRGDGEARYVITNGGLRGFFTHDQRGAIAGVDLAGRLFTRAPTASQ
jgi:hypothetical protein